MGCLPCVDERQGSSTIEAECVRVTSHSAGHRGGGGFGECSTDTAIPQPPLPRAPRLPLLPPLPLHRAAPPGWATQPLLRGDAPWPLRGVASVTTALTTNCGTQLHRWGKRLDAQAPQPNFFSLSRSDDLGDNCTASAASRVCNLFDNMDNLIITGLDVVDCAWNHEKYTAHSIIPK